MTSLLRRLAPCLCAVLIVLLASASLAGSMGGSLTNPGVNTADDPVVWTGTHTNTSQPCFLAFNSATDTDVTGFDATATVDFDTEVFDQNGDFAADTFTAPVAGRYSLVANVRFSGVTAVADSAVLLVVTSNRSYRASVVDTDDVASDSTLSLAVAADMDAADTVTVTLQVSGEGTNVVDINGAAGPETSFSGCLLN